MSAKCKLGRRQIASGQSWVSNWRQRNVASWRGPQRHCSSHHFLPVTLIGRVCVRTGLAFGQRLVAGVACSEWGSRLRGIRRLNSLLGVLPANQLTGLTEIVEWPAQRSVSVSLCLRVASLVTKLTFAERRHFGDSWIDSGRVNVARKASLESRRSVDRRCFLVRISWAKWL